MQKVIFGSAYFKENYAHRCQSAVLNLLFSPVAYLGYGRHDTCHERNFERGAKIAWQN